MSAPAQRIVLVTGASRGIGRAVAERFGREGAHLILIARTKGGLTEADDAIRAAGGSATLVPLDLTDADGLDRLAAAVAERWGRLDVLVGNAGFLGPLSLLRDVDPPDWERLMAVNVTANWRLIRAFEPLLRQSEAGRAIFVTSGAAHKHQPFWGGYAVTKAALECLALTWASELEKTAIRVNLVSPGAVRTTMRAKAMPGEDASTLPHPDELGDLFVALASPDETRNGQIVAFQRPG